MPLPPEVLIERPTHPLRPPDWRWQLAAAVHEMSPNDQDRIVPRLDPLVAVAYDVQTHTRATQTDTQRAQLWANADPAAADAFDFWTAATTSRAQPAGRGAWDLGPLGPEPLAMAALDGLILAGRPAEKCGRYVGLSAAAVGWYEAWWFDVRGRLRSPGWVAANVIGSLHQGEVTTLLPALIRAYGYYTRSARVVKTAASGFDAAVAHRAGRDVGRFFAADAAAAGALKAALVARMLPVHDPRTFARVIELHHEALDVEVKARQFGGSEDAARLKAAADVLVGRIETGYGAAPVDDDDVRRLPRLVQAADAPEDGQSRAG